MAAVAFEDQPVAYLASFLELLQPASKSSQFDHIRETVLHTTRMIRLVSYETLRVVTCDL